jgi:citrate synthase
LVSGRVNIIFETTKAGEDSMEKVAYSKGLEGVIASETAISEVDGEKGKLYYYGYTIEDLVQHCSFEEVTYLLLYGELPNLHELETFTHKIRSARDLHPQILEMIREFPKDAHPMELLQSVISYLSGYVEHRIQHSASCNCRTTLHQVAQLGSVVAAYQRFREGKEYVPPRNDLSYGANFLYMLHGKDPDPIEGQMMDNMLTLHAEHGFNASTFTARVVASTLSTCYCSISAAIGALYGSLHGGANEKTMEMVEHIGSKGRAREWINRALDQKQKISGMGHRVYKTKDPRAILVEEYLRQLSERKNNFTYYNILKETEVVFRERMEEKGKPIYPNVDFFSGAVYALMGIPRTLFTPVFAIARGPGWLAHVLEQRVDNRLFRPDAIYTGELGRKMVPIEERP